MYSAARHRGGRRYRKRVVSQLLACPFCRELFEQTETDHCPECDVALQPLQRLAPSYEVAEEEAVRWERTRPEDELRPFLELRRGRGALLALAALSLGLFWLSPWVNITSPQALVRSGYSLARGPLGFLWGGAVAWFVTIALVTSRRSIRQMRGVRAILMLFAAITASEILVLLALSPSRSREVYVAYEWAWGLYASLGASAVGVCVAARFGGALPPAEPVPLEPAASARGSTETVH
jgi:hypothetical protein